MERVALLRSRGIIPHLSVILPTRDEAAHAYFRAKARAAEKLGIAVEWCTSLERAMQSVSVVPADVDDKGKFQL